ncbi:RNA polymerase subunit sigma-24 [Dehalobacter sp. MCB1]|uniref:RNA polymerase sigma factor n=1 Tax=unclassified Dehalobacter TaxID=2635733 RepID=UPI000E6C2A82|nr:MULTISPECIES: sigma factor-like helix-turn-helix DNA-binding protein [unclassified Dehalobacter]RJE47926.1 RNA polymerase subunit sigma-24 [Dehalobacter sp. MCB1]TCX56104.1 RNA polymerase subunit sigma-24 [Dehalobacter sp. 12DCB1]
MERINLRDYYPFYQFDFFVEVADEIASSLKLFKLSEKAYQLRIYRHKAYYSLDRGDGIEQEIVFISLSPQEIYERKVTNRELYAAINSLPEKQAKRIYAYFFLGISKAAIARADGIGESAVRESIERGLKNIEKFLKNFG